MISVFFTFIKMDFLRTNDSIINVLLLLVVLVFNLAKNRNIFNLSQYCKKLTGWAFCERTSPLTQSLHGQPVIIHFQGWIIFRMWHLHIERSLANHIPIYTVNTSIPVSDTAYYSCMRLLCLFFIIQTATVLKSEKSTVVYCWLWHY